MHIIFIYAHTDEGFARLGILWILVGIVTNIYKYVLT